MKVEPVNNIVMIRKDPTPERSSGGIYMVPGQGVEVETGVVVAISKYRSSDPSIANGVRVALSPHSGFHTITVDGEKFSLIRESEILAILRG